MVIKWQLMGADERPQSAIIWIAMIRGHYYWADRSLILPSQQARTPESGDMLLRSFPQREYQHRPCEQRNAVKMGVPYCSRKLALSYVASKRTKSRQFSCPILP